MDKKLISLGVLSLQWEKFNKSYLDNFVPLFATMLVDKQIKTLELKNLEGYSSLFREQFDISLRAYFVKPIIMKMFALCLINKGADSASFIVNTQNIIDSNYYIENEVDSFTNTKNKILQEFINYVKKTFNKEISEDDANRIILCFVRNNDADVLLKEQKILDGIKENEQSESYMIGKFVSTIFVEDNTLYKDFVKLAVGSIAFNALFCVPIDLDEQSLKKCVFYFDSSLIFPILGKDINNYASVVKDIAQELHSRGAFVKIFQHTYEEIEDILDTALRFIDSPDYDPSKATKALFYMRQQGYTRSKVEIIKATILNTLKENYIFVEKEIPDKKLFINENDLETEIKKNLTFHKYVVADNYNLRTTRDVNSIVYTYEKRKKLYSKDFIDAKYSFITENALLVKSDKKIILPMLQNENKNKDYFFSATIPDSLLCSYLWLGNAQEAVQTATFSVFSLAFASINSTPNLEAKLREEARTLLEQNKLTPAAYNIVVTSHIIKDALAEHTLCSVENINAETVFSLVEDAKDIIASEERAKRKRAEEIVYNNILKDEKRRKKAERKARTKTCLEISIMRILFIASYILFSVPSFSCDNRLFSTLLIPTMWALFCYFHNHEKPISLKNTKEKLYIKNLKYYYGMFELEFDKVKI